MHGTPSGVDNATCTYGGLVRFRRGEPARVLRAPASLRVLLVDTRVSRRTRALAERVAARRAREPAAVDCIVRACGHLTDSAEQIFEKLSNCEGDTDSLYEHLAELWGACHCLLAALGASHGALEAVRRAAAAHGLEAKLTGAGGGGCVSAVHNPPLLLDTHIEVV
ncbi:mevalonate kinase-like [Pararge aegeria]|uniref:mevalonate kinase-like n=1 Tax=Pararge aegeria TaxID=116150 RepID=UPI0019D18C22|nr:mevalonate kinase-like [Pararge aegeria]XP_039764411.1 mevalonate kinase-like [Pararge aegeria]